MRQTRPYTYLSTVQGMCRACRSLVPCRIIEVDGAVYQERICPTCGRSRARIADSVEWYAERVRQTVHLKPARLPGTPVCQGCPQDCGPCSFHASACHLPVVSITNVCNMACPICFTYNRPDRRYFMGRAELRRLVDDLVDRAAPLDLINITGGEPTLHPRLLDLLEECQRPEIGRVTVNTNGLRLAEDDSLCRELARLGVYVILSFDTLRSETSHWLHGRDVVQLKLSALANLERHGIGTTLMNVMVRGVNEDEIGSIIRLTQSHRVVRSITVQTMTYTGSGGKSFRPRDPVPLDGAAAAIERTTGGSMSQEHFFAHPGAHPLCYSIAYYLKVGRRLVSFTEFLSVGQLREMLGSGYLLGAWDTSFEHFRSAMDRMWAEGGDTQVLRCIKDLIRRLYPPSESFSFFERQRLAEQDILTVYLHSHMDEDTLDLSRLVVCPDQVPDDGRMIPACAYNLFYRQKDPRFWAEGELAMTDEQG